MKKIFTDFNSYLFNKETKEAFNYWIKLIISPRGIWFFLPTLLGILLVYWLMGHGCYDTEATIKPFCDNAALLIIVPATIVFLIRVFIYRNYIDIIMLVMAASFSCREIKFTGTQLGVMIVAGIVFVWIIFWKDRLLREIKNADIFQVVLTSTVFTYLIAFLVQRGALKHILPNIDMASEGIEELLENVGHLMFLITGIVSFFSLNINKKKEIK
jgi:hypothetical protein